jgi:hypothetical protein
MGAADGRVTDYDRIADRFDKRPSAGFRSFYAD